MVADVCKPQCPLCGIVSLSSVPYRAKTPYFEGLSLYACQSCGMTYTFPVPSEKKLSEFYAGYWSEGECDRKRATFLAQAHARVAFMRAHGLSGDATVLDVGAGYGFTKEALDSARIMTKYDAVETDEKAVAAMRDRGILRNAYSSAGDVGGSYSLIVLAHIIEHFSHPVAFLRQVAARLDDGGLLFVEVPHGDHRYKAFNEPHLSFFSKEALVRAVAAAGFDVVACETCGPKAVIGVNGRKGRVRSGVVQKIMRRAMSIISRYGWFGVFRDYAVYGGDRVWLRLVARKRS